MSIFDKLAILLILISPVNSFAATISEFKPSNNWRFQYEPSLDIDKVFLHDVYGYFDGIRGPDGKLYYRLEFTNGTRSDYAFQAEIHCVSTDGETKYASTRKRERLGWSTGGHVKRAYFYDISCNNGKVGVYFYQPVRGVGWPEIEIIGKALMTFFGGG